MLGVRLQGTEGKRNGWSINFTTPPECVQTSPLKIHFNLQKIYPNANEFNAQKGGRSPGLMSQITKRQDDSWKATRHSYSSWRLNLRSRCVRSAIDSRNQKRSIGFNICMSSIWNS